MKKNDKITILLLLLLIMGLGVSLIHIFKKYSSLNDGFQIYKNDKELIINYQASSIKDLKEQNKELYDKYKNDKTIEYIVQYKYKYIHDTIFVEPTEVKPTEDLDISEYLYTSDTTKFFKYQIGVLSSTQPKKLSFNYELNDKFTIINKADGNNNQTIIGSESGVEVDPTVVFKRKQTFWSKFKAGPQIGVGVGTFNKNVDVYVGFGITYDITK